MSPHPSMEFLRVILTSITTPRRIFVQFSPWIRKDQKFFTKVPPRPRPTTTKTASDTQPEIVFRQAGSKSATPKSTQQSPDCLIKDTLPCFLARMAESDIALNRNATLLSILKHSSPSLAANLFH